MYQDNPMMVAYEAAKELHFAPHPLGHSVLGTVESIEALQVEQMRDYFERRYCPRNIVLAVAGKTSWQEVQDLAAQYCAPWKGGEANRPHRSGHRETLFKTAEPPENPPQKTTQSPSSNRNAPFASVGRPSDFSRSASESSSHDDRGQSVSFSGIPT